MIKPNEALVLHIFAGGSGFVTTCIESNCWTFNFKPLDGQALKELDSDYKLLLAAVHASHAPSAVLDSEFPAESSYHLYQSFFGGIETCLQNKTHILLATDPDFFSLPWNALLTKKPSKDHKFRNRDAAWLPRSYSLSLLPSVRSLFQLRTNLPLSQAKENFLGIGAPDLEGAPDQSKQIALAPLFVARGIANRTAIADLPALPETADELRTVAKILETSDSHILLGRAATERELRKHALNDYRVISFATHALVAGEIEGITEPALVLTPGADAHDPQNDGLLTATEIANLALDANLVILSACNTAASDGRASGRGLSGLADAFFFAGARSVAVTQWTLDSETATQIGSGLISRSEGHHTGVAEGLRQTMVEYISTAKEDYLAHPYFWAAFIIAGDGAVRPLDGGTATNESRNPIKFDWDYLSPDIADDEFVGLAKGLRSTFAIGIQRPPAGEQRAGSYFVQIPADKTVAVISRDREMAASGVVSLGAKIGLLGFYPGGDKSAAVFRVLEQDGHERWRYTEDSKLWNFPVSIIRTADGYILISIEKDFSPSAGSSTLVLNLVSDSGVAINRQRIPVPLRDGYSRPNNVAIDSEGNLIVAVYGRILETPPAKSAMWTNPRTGSKKFCVTPYSTVLLSIGIKTLQLQYKRILEGDQVVSIHGRDGHLYTAISFVVDCRLEMNIRLAELGPKFELKSIFQTNSVNSVVVRDFVITADQFVLVGGVQTFLPTALTREIMSLEELKHYKVPNPWDDSTWEQNEAHANAFVLVTSKDGTLLADRVFPDPLNRSISDVAEITRNHFLAVGSGFGGRGWAFAFNLREPGSNFRNHFEVWLRWIWASFGISH